MRGSEQHRRNFAVMGEAFFTHTGEARQLFEADQDRLIESLEMLLILPPGDDFFANTLSNAAREPAMRN